MSTERVKVSNRMRVSFDLDEVLFVSPETHKTEPDPIFPFNLIFKERLRLGTPDLIHRLQNEGFEVWVYTSSFRTERYIRSLFRLYGVKFTAIVNGERHLREVKGRNTNPVPQKLPCKYRISLHIDDEKSVMVSGKVHGFNVYQLDAQDDEWEEKIMQRLYEIRKRERPDLVENEV